MSQWCFVRRLDESMFAVMQEKLTISLDEAVYEDLARLVGRGKISKFIEDLVRPHVTRANLAVGFQAMAAGESRKNAS